MIGLKKSFRLAKRAGSTISCGMFSIPSRNHSRPQLAHADAVRFFASVSKGGLRVDEQLVDLVKEICPGTGIEPESFWFSFGKMVKENHTRNKELLDKRDSIQHKIDEFHQGRAPIEFDKYKKFLKDIGYLVPEKEPFSITTDFVDPEISVIAGPQLVCPVDNPRFILNAANARWGSLLDAFYGTDVIPEDDGALRGREYNPKRGEKVFQEVFRWMDEIFPLKAAKYSQVQSFTVSEGKFSVTYDNGRQDSLKNAEQFVGFLQDGDVLKSILLRNNGLHFEILIDRKSSIGKTNIAGVKDVVVESALTAIADCEDSVAAVDAEDKVQVYKTWTGLMKRSLSVEMEKGSRIITRRMNSDRTWTTPSGQELRLPGTTVLLVRNVGMHLYTDAVTLEDGSEIPEHMLDLAVTSLASLHDLRSNAAAKNSRAGSVYIVRPKMHGPEEVAFVNTLFDATEDFLGMRRNTLKMGMMDEERRMTVNLHEAIRAAKDRIVFINTGFLDRTGDEIHTSFRAGPFYPKAELKQQPWLKAYEDWNVDCGMMAKLPGRAQIGKGMWAAPDNMRQMLKEKIGHPMAGANCAWVPNPTAASLHALHYHKCSVQQVQREHIAGRPRANLDHILQVPLLKRKLTAEEVKKELNNNCQSILGYVVRWVGQGVGCSKVPDINDTQLMEDRATLRISAQLIANWLYHNIVSKEQVIAGLKEMAAVVDRQNQGDAAYTPMVGNFEGLEFQAAVKLILDGKDIANGYTEGTLVQFRRDYKKKHRS